MGVFFLAGTERVGVFEAVSLQAEAGDERLASLLGRRSAAHGPESRCLAPGFADRDAG